MARYSASPAGGEVKLRLATNGYFLPSPITCACVQAAPAGTVHDGFVISGNDGRVDGAVGVARG
jgi:hypothetical protein